MCTGIELISNQGNPYWGRTQDFEQQFEYSGIKIPKGSNFTSTFTPFITKINVMGIVWAEDIHKSPVLLDGINDYGICGGSFYFDHDYRYTETKKIHNQSKIAIRGEELCTWILTHYKSLNEITMNVGNDIGITNETGPMMGMSVPQHCVFQDETGRSIVIEPSVTGGFKIFENKVGVFTNAPTFDWHLTNLKHQLEKSLERKYSYSADEPITPIDFSETTGNLLSIPMDYKPESRFLRAAISKLLSVTTDDKDSLNQIFQLLTTVNTPKGSLRIKQDSSVAVAWTQYTSGYDIKNKILYAFTYNNRNMQELQYGDPKTWGKDIRYFSFNNIQTTTPFIEKNVWKPGENTLS